MSQKPLVVGVVGNDIVNDSRVKKVAASAAKAGYRSAIVCYSPTGRRIDSKMGEVDVARIPVPFAFTNTPSRVPQPTRPIQATELAKRHLGPRTQQMARRRRLESEVWASEDGSRNHTRLSAQLQLLRLAIWVRRQGFRLRRRFHVTVDRVIRRFNLSRTRVSLKFFKRFRNPVSNLLDYEVAFGPELEDLEPEIIHAHDYHMIGIAVTAARRLRSRGINTRVVYDAHELVEGLSYPQEVIDGWLADEAKYIRAADAVIGVSPEQARRIQELYDLASPPTVVLNAPLRVADHPISRNIRSDTTPDGRILVYHGNIAEERGVFTMVEALSLLPNDVHIAMLAPSDHPMIEQLETTASKASVADRLHILGFVPAEDLAGYLESADLAVVPYLLTGNNDIALPNKLFEAIQAGLPVLVSDMRSLSRFVSNNQIGLVFKQGDAGDLADKAMAMLDGIGPFLAALTPDVKRDSEWDAQAEKLIAIYDELQDWGSATEVHIDVSDIVEPPSDASWGDYRPKRLAIGPRNMAGQAYLIARAVETQLGIPARSFSVEKAKFGFPVDQQITPEAWRDPDWQLHQRRLLSSTFTHVLAESGTGMLGTLNGGFVDEQMEVFDIENLPVGIILHGSEIRDPRRHRLLPFSPYASDDALIKALEKGTARLRRHLEGLNSPLFVTTPDLLEDVDATWLPVVVETELWAALDEAFQAETPTVFHLPSNGLLKGSDYVDRVLGALQDEGLIHYLRPTDALTAEGVAHHLERSDIVVDGIVIGAYGVMACQAMAAGRIAIANIRDLGPLADKCPIIDGDPSTLESVLRRLLRGRENWKETAEAGRDYAATYHDGSYTAQQLRPFLGLT